MNRRDFLKTISLATIGILSPVSLEMVDFDYQPSVCFDYVNNELYIINSANPVIQIGIERINTTKINTI